MRYIRKIALIGILTALAIVLSILEQYGIDEEEALDLYTMSDYNQYYDILESFGGITE